MSTVNSHPVKHYKRNFSLVKTKAAQENNHLKPGFLRRPQALSHTKLAPIWSAASVLNIARLVSILFTRDQWSCVHLSLVNWVVQHAAPTTRALDSTTASQVLLSSYKKVWKDARKHAGPKLGHNRLVVTKGMQCGWCNCSGCSGVKHHKLWHQQWSTYPSPPRCQIPGLRWAALKCGLKASGCSLTAWAKPIGGFVFFHLKLYLD